MYGKHGKSMEMRNLWIYFLKIWEIYGKHGKSMENLWKI